MVGNRSPGENRPVRMASSALLAISLAVAPAMDGLDRNVELRVY